MNKLIKCDVCGDEYGLNNIIWVKEVGKKAINYCDSCYAKSKPVLPQGVEGKAVAGTVMDV